MSNTLLAVAGAVLMTTLISSARTESVTYCSVQATVVDGISTAQPVAIGRSADQNTTTNTPAPPWTAEVATGLRFTSPTGPCGWRVADSESFDRACVTPAGWVIIRPSGLTIIVTSELTDSGAVRILRGAAVGVVLGMAPCSEKVCGS